jgi:hypothetical protein
METSALCVSITSHNKIYFHRQYADKNCEIPLDLIKLLIKKVIQRVNEGASNFIQLGDILHFSTLQVHWQRRVSDGNWVTITQDATTGGSQFTRKRAGTSDVDGTGYLQDSDQWLLTDTLYNCYGNPIGDRGTIVPHYFVDAIDPHGGVIVAVVTDCGGL